MVRNSSARSRTVTTGGGAVEVTAPRGTAGSIRRPVSAAGSPAPSFLPTSAAPRRSPRSCPCCTCTGCPRRTSSPALAEFFGLLGALGGGCHQAHGELGVVPTDVVHSRVTGGSPPSVVWGRRSL